MIEDTISSEEARRFYNRLGAGHDWADRYEGRAKRRALLLLDLAPGQRVLNVGIGTGQVQAHIEAAIAPAGLAFGLDLAPVMLDTVQSRTRHTLLCESDLRHLPFASACFDRIFSSYVLDLLSTRYLPGLLTGFRRVLKPGGWLVLVTLTEGVTLPSRALVALWKMAYAVSPVACGGCRPVQLAGLVHQAGFNQVRREVVVQLAVPSEIIVATR
jgi:demethylmenaquinone methyltransferase/2-methoxy-6-polyprenyl-1,4-benzoquinol methylase